ncbi:hypothetical protein [Trinickia fusca]|uniref:Uncharacterized protein n=1 Tax=Trinickia fusca TaxID=2419777 RepID=A0A494X3F9_9BURK|nr:hypothetical protein [Trinickia fusca]RKP45225.1 hypothetical protein D7S89_20570 [Trinickia fusca]
MKNFLARAVMASIFFSPIASRAFDGVVTLTSRDVPYEASITLREAGKGSDGKRKVAYQVKLKSTTCQSVISGQATFFTRRDDPMTVLGGDLVKTSVYRDDGDNGHVELVMDVESKKPRFASVDIDNPKTTPSGCVDKKGDGWNFFDWPGASKGK